MTLVMTSGNRSDEPIAYQDDEALERLKDIADLFLIHDRPIHVRCDDSVTRAVGGVELPLRRSRGYAPEPISLPFACPAPILAVGGQLKGAFALGRGNQAFVSHHMGDLDDFGAYQAFVRDIELYQQLIALKPALLAHDSHPDYASTRYAAERGARDTLPCLKIQHHHAHMASCMAEHGLDERVIGVTLDGAGYGTDGAVWGGEFLVGDYRRYKRAGHLRYLPMPGGEGAIREPWRMARACLEDARTSCAPWMVRISQEKLQIVDKLLERRFNCPKTSSAGRLFDAVASLAGVRDSVTYEGQAAIELEWLAQTCKAAGTYPFELIEARSDAASVDITMVVDTRPLVAAVAQEVVRRTPSDIIARRFHSTMVDIIAAICVKLRAMTKLDAVVLSGGVFLNALLTHEVCVRLGAEGFRVYRHRRVPPGDGGLSLGQLAIAAAAGEAHLGGRP
jgi:hydrogenase maturation protein HypF